MFIKLVFSPVLIACLGVGAAFAQSQTADERRPLVARDVCMAMATKFASGDSIEFENGRFRVVKGTQSVTVYEGAAPIASIPGFTFSEYNHCLDVVFSSFERARPITDSKAFVEAFSAGYELSQIQSIGVCIQPAAMGGLYLGDTLQGNLPLQRDRIEKLVIAASKSIARRVKRFSNRDISLDLVSNVRFYNYYPDKLVPYFSTDAIEDSNDILNDVVSSALEDYVNMGRFTGRLKVTFLFATLFSATLASTQGHGDERAFRMQSYLPGGLQCLRAAYEQERSQLYQASRELRISLQIPDFAQAVSNGQAIASALNDDKTWVERYFDERVTTKIRQVLRDAS
jgi:hypothetical protein